MEIVNHVEIRDGKAVIRGHGHLKAEMVARQYIWEGQSVEDVMEHYGLAASEVHSAIAYYYDNRETLDAEYEQTVREFEDQALTLEKLKQRIAQRQQGNADE